MSPTISGIQRIGLDIRMHMVDTQEVPATRDQRSEPRAIQALDGVAGFRAPNFICSGGHTFYAPADAATAKCPARLNGAACSGTLRRVGPGSRKATAGA